MNGFDWMVGGAEYVLDSPYFCEEVGKKKKEEMCIWSISQT